MKNNRILNVVSLINKRYQSELTVSDKVIKDLSNTIREVRGNNYITDDELISIVRMMVKYAND